MLRAGPRLQTKSAWHLIADSLRQPTQLLPCLARALSSLHQAAVAADAEPYTSASQAAQQHPQEAARPPLPQEAWPSFEDPAIRQHIPNNHQIAPQALGMEYPFSAKAFYVGRGLTREAKELYDTVARADLPCIWSSADARLLCVPPLTLPAAPLCAGALPRPVINKGQPLPCRHTYVAVFESMDSIVFFNGAGREVELWRQYTGGTLLTREVEELRVAVRPALSGASAIGEDAVVLRAAQPDLVRTIAYTLAQTVALHFYETEVDTMLRVFQDINAGMERSGEIGPTIAKEELLRMVAKNNVMRTGILSSKIGLTKRFDAAWRDPECGRLYGHLREEMEISQRFEDLEVKFDLIQDNLKYFLEMLQNKKSDFLEYMIVILIAAEIAVSLFDLWTREALSKIA